MCGWRLNRESLRQLTHGTARRLAATRGDRNDAARFARAEGVIEVAVDAGKVNAVGGGRDVKLAIICKRPAGQPAAADGWTNRQLPAPTARAAVASVEGCGTFAERVRAETDRLGATAATDVTVPSGSGTRPGTCGRRRPGCRIPSTWPRRSGTR